MKCLLIEPPQLFLEGIGQTRQVQSLGLAYVGAMLQTGHEVRLLIPDTRIYHGKNPWRELGRAIDTESPDVVGITSVTSTLPSAMQLAKLIKCKRSRTTIVLGGCHASIDPIGVLTRCPHIDFVVIGEGEVTMLELVDWLSDMPRGQPGHIPGLAFRSTGGQVYRTPKRAPLANLDRLPFALRKNLVWPEDIQPGFYQAVITQRGCPYDCIFCSAATISGRSVRHRTPEQVVEEIKMLRHAYAIDYLFFHDSVFSLNRDHTKNLCALLEKQGSLPFTCQTRVDRIDPDLLRVLKRAGCHQIIFGIESGDDASLGRIKKRFDVETVKMAVQWVKDADIGCSGFFMLGFPWETEAQILRTADLACDLELDVINLFSATPLPGTELWRMCEPTLQKSDPSWAGSDFRTPGINLTRMRDSDYTALFERVKARVESANRVQMKRRLSAFKCR